MSLSQRIINRLRTDFFKKLYLRNVDRVLETPPLKPGKLPFIALSMVHQRDVISYLVAIKSFARFTNPERVVIVCDPTIGEHEKGVFKSHIPHAELRNAVEFRDPRIPVGGCWERLSAITTYSPESYVVQLDADTVTLDTISEVTLPVMQQNGFVLGEKRNQEILTLEEASKRAMQSTSKHIQALSEQVLADAGLNGSFYIRGCAGFTGFPADSDMRDKFFDFSEKMAAKTLKRWSEWGTEQVTSNYLVANAAGTLILPYPKYSTPFRQEDVGAFLHFIGEIRFRSRAYEKASLQAMSSFHH
jgi:hypothetical protein